MNRFIKTSNCILSLTLLTLVPFSNFAQSFAPSPGFPETDAIYKDSAVFVAWATQVIVNRGPMNIQDPSLGNVAFGNESDALLIADNNIVSLGDGGSAVATFTNPIQNGSGPDFAVFENGFADNYMELAFVEVSSDGINYTRFESVSETPTDSQIDNFSFSDCRYIYNLAGKYRVYYGTPFDLAELQETEGLDINNITSIRIIDVVGTIENDLASFDSQGNAINDPYPTPFESGGFDLDAIGVIHSAELSIEELTRNVVVYPNPANDYIHTKGFTAEKKYVVNLMGRIVSEFIGESHNIESLTNGVYVIRQGEKNIKFTKN